MVQYRKRGEDKRESQVNVRATEKEKDMMEEIAEEFGMSQAEIIILGILVLWFFTQQRGYDYNKIKKTYT